MSRLPQLPVLVALALLTEDVLDQRRVRRALDLLVRRFDRPKEIAALDGLKDLRWRLGGADE